MRFPLLKRRFVLLKEPSRRAGAAARLHEALRKIAFARDNACGLRKALSCAQAASTAD